MDHYVKPTLSTQPDEIILHIGTNNLKDNNPADAITAMGKLGDTITRVNENVKLSLSEVITRSDDHDMAEKVTIYNEQLARLCKERKWHLIRNNNIHKSHLNPYGVHLNRTGTGIFAKNIKQYLGANNNKNKYH